MKRSRMKIWVVGSLMSLLMVGAQSKDLSFVGQEYPPYNWTEGGEFKGGMIDLLKRACEKLKYKCTFTSVPLARAVLMLEEGSADGVMSLLPNADRAAYSNLGPPLITSSLSYFGIKGKAQKLGGVKGLDGWTVGVTRGSISVRLAQANKNVLNNLTVVEEVSNTILVKKLQGDRYGDKGAILGNDAVLGFEAQKINLELESILDGEPQGFSTAFSKKSVDEQTLSELTKTLETMKKNGESKSILSKYRLRSE